MRVSSAASLASAYWRSSRLEWWRQRWRNELVPTATITVAERNGKLVGFVTVDPRTLDLDQMVVASEAWGSDVASALLAGDKTREIVSFGEASIACLAREEPGDWVLLWLVSPRLVA